VIGPPTWGNGYQKSIAVHLGAVQIAFFFVFPWTLSPSISDARNYVLGHVVVFDKILVTLPTSSSRDLTYGD
jgi:hypothetical protein